MVPITPFASRLAPADHATKPLWEACSQANGQRPRDFAAKAASHSGFVAISYWSRSTILWHSA